MGILSNIFGKIFQNKDKDAAATPAGGLASPTPNAGVPSAPAPSAANTANPQQAGTPATASPAGMSETDVEAVLNGMAAKEPQKLNWQTSIVDLMKLLDIDNSLQSRKELAKELNYSGDMSDSASMNIWLHKQVMKQLAANGGKVPAALLD